MGSVPSNVESLLLSFWVNLGPVVDADLVVGRYVPAAGLRLGADLAAARLDSARSRGKVGGRPKTLTPKEVQMLNNMAADKPLTVADICKTLGIGRTTFYRYVKAEENS